MDVFLLSFCLNLICEHQTSNIDKPHEFFTQSVSQDKCSYQNLQPRLTVLNFRPQAQAVSIWHCQVCTMLKHRHFLQARRQLKCSVCGIVKPESSCTSMYTISQRVYSHSCKTAHTCLRQPDNGKLQWKLTYLVLLHACPSTAVAKAVGLLPLCFRSLGHPASRVVLDLK